MGRRRDYYDCDRRNNGNVVVAIIVLLIILGIVFAGTNVFIFDND